MELPDQPKKPRPSPDQTPTKPAKLDPMFQNRLSWYLGVSAYWFASSFKWFMALLLIPAKVNAIVPVGQQNSTWGMIVAIGALEATVGPALMGYLSDRTSTKWGRRRPWLLSGAVLTAVACFLLGSAQSVGALIFGYLLLQISDDIATGPYSALIPENVPPQHRGRASGIMGMLNFSAQICAAILIIAGTLLSIDHFILFLFLGGLNVACALIVCKCAQEAPNPEVTAGKFSFGIWVDTWRSANFRWVWFTRFLTSLGFYVMTTFGQNYLKDSVKTFSPLPTSVTEGSSGPLIAALAIMVLISITGIIGATVGGKLADKIGRRKVIRGAGMILFAVLLPFSLIPVYQVMLGLALIFGIGYGAYASADWALVSDVLPEGADFGKDMGIWQSSIALPQLFNGMIGVGIDAGNRAQPGAGYTFAFMMSAVFFLLGSLLIVKIKIDKGGIPGADVETLPGSNYPRTPAG